MRGITKQKVTKGEKEARAWLKSKFKDSDYKRFKILKTAYIEDELYTANTIYCFNCSYKMYKKEKAVQCTLRVVYSKHKGTYTSPILL